MYDTSYRVQSIAGCDSILTLDLTINESYDDVVDKMYRCVGDSALAGVPEKWGVCRYVTECYC